MRCPTMPGPPFDTLNERHVLYVAMTGVNRPAARVSLDVQSRREAVRKRHLQSEARPTNIATM